MGRNLGPLNIKDSYEGLVQISGSDQLTDGSGSLIPSLDVTASYATFAESSSADSLTLQEVTDNGAVTTNDITIDGRIFSDAGITNSVASAGFTVQAGTVDATLTLQGNDALATNSIKLNPTNGIQLSGSVDSQNDITAPTFIGDLTGNADTATSASYATTASLALALDGGVSLQSVLDTGNTATEDINLTGDIQATNVTASFKGNLEGNADSATQVQVSNNDSDVEFGVVFTGLAASGNPSDLYRDNDDQFKFNASTETLTVTNINATSITASNASFTSASIGYLEAITGSAKIIGDAFIILNNNTPTERFAGLVVQDSGSTQNTASLEFDGQTNDWFYEYTDDGGATVDHGVAMFGPEYNTKGSPVYPTNNRLLKGDGGHHIEDSSITDDGSKVTSTVPLADMVLSGSKTVISGSLDIVLPTDASDVNIINPDEKLALIVRGGIMAGSDQDLSTDNGFNNHLFGERITADSSAQTCGALAGREVEFGGNPIEYAAFIATQASTFDSGNKSAIIGGSSHTIDTEDSVAEENVIIGGQSHRLGAGERNAIIAGLNNTIIEGNSKVIIGGKNHTLGYDSGVAEYSGSVIVGGEGHLSKHNNTVILGGMNITSSADNTVYVPNLTLTGSGATLTFDDGTTQTSAATAGLLITGSSYYVAAATGISATNEVAIGDDVSATGGNNVAIGADASANGFGVAVGQNATMDGSGVAIGRNANAAGFGDAIGYDSDATGSFGLAIGRGTQANGTRTTALGSGANASTTDGIAIGANTNATGSFTLNIGNKILGNDDGSYYLGDNPVSYGDSTDMVVLGGINTSLGSNSNLRYGFVAGGGNNNFGTNNGAMGQSVMLGGNGNTMNSADDSAIIGGGSNSLTHSRSVILGGTSLSSTKGNEVTLEHLNVQGTVNQHVQSITITSNTGSIDASTGNLFEITLGNGVDTQLEIENQTAGQTFQLKITNNATAAGTISFDSQFEFEGGTAFTATAATGAVDILTLTTFDGTSVQCVGAKNFS